MSKRSAVMLEFRKAV